MQKGEIWLNYLDPSKSAKIRKSRPVVIVSVDEIGILSLRIIVSLIVQREHYARAPWMVRVSPNRGNGLFKPSAADAFQVRSISKQKFIQKIGVLEAETLGKIIQGIQVVVGGVQEADLFEHCNRSDCYTKIVPNDRVLLKVCQRSRKKNAPWQEAFLNYNPNDLAIKLQES